MARNRRRTRAQRRYLRQGYTWELATLRAVSPRVPKLVVIQKASTSRKEYRPHLNQWLGEFIRPVCKIYIHKGGKP